MNPSRLHRLKRPLLLLCVVTPCVLWACGFWFLKTRDAPIKVADTAPEFVLADARGVNVSLNEMTRLGPAVMVFYRGHW